MESARERKLSSTHDSRLFFVHFFSHVVRVFLFSRASVPPRSFHRESVSFLQSPAVFSQVRLGSTSWIHSASITIGVEGEPVVVTSGGYLPVLQEARGLVPWRRVAVVSTPWNTCCATRDFSARASHRTWDYRVRQIARIYRISVCRGYNTSRGNCPILTARVCLSRAIVGGDSVILCVAADDSRGSRVFSGGRWNLRVNHRWFLVRSVCSSAVTRISARGPSSRDNQGYRATQ